MSVESVKCRRGAAAVEIALVVFPLVLFIIGVMETAFDFYAQQALDFALYEAVRRVATGSIQSTATSLATFQSNVFCPVIAGLLPCASISVNVTPVDTISAANTAVPMTGGNFNPNGFKYCPGQPGQLMLAQAVYPAPSFLGQLLPGGYTIFNGQPVRLIAAVAGFVNEPYTATASPPAGC